MKSRAGTIITGIGGIMCFLLLQGCAKRETPIEMVRRGSPEQIARGEHLVVGIAACGFCHGREIDPDAPLVGGMEIEDRYGSVIAPNLTPHASGIGGYSVAEVANAFRFSDSINDRFLSREVHEGYDWMADNDAVAIVLYLKSLSPVRHETPLRDVDFLDRNTTGFFERTPEMVAGYIPELPKRFVLQYGRYLTDHVARCGVCHSTQGSLLEDPRYLGGGREFHRNGRVKVAPRISSDGIGGLAQWSADEVLAFLRTGQTPDKRLVDPEFCPVEFFKNGSDEELQAIAAFLKSTGS